jgi:hypothetical protein
VAKAASLVPCLVRSKVIQNQGFGTLYFLKTSTPKREQEHFCSTKSEAPTQTTGSDIPDVTLSRYLQAGTRAAVYYFAIEQTSFVRVPLVTSIYGSNAPAMIAML